MASLYQPILIDSLQFQIIDPLTFSIVSGVGVDQTPAFVGYNGLEGPSGSDPEGEP
jgi:hypothetical protein